MYYTVLLVIHTIIVLFLIVMVLIQRTDSDGLGGLSGGGGNQFLTGRSAANILTRTTAFLAGGFMLTSLILASMAGHMNRSSIVDLPVTEQNIPAEAAKDLSKNAEPAGKDAPPESKAPAAEKESTPAVPKPE